MMKKYEYNGKIYCDEDLSCDIDNYGGDLFDLFWELKRKGKVEEHTTYYCRNSGTFYDSIEDFIEQECEDLEVD
jgi:hypothetical protein